MSAYRAASGSVAEDLFIELFSDTFGYDLLKQNSMIYLGWDVYCWAVRQMQRQPETIKDERRVFLGTHPQFREIDDYLPTQRGKALDGAKLELKQHQKDALAALENMRKQNETIFLIVPPYQS